MRDHVSLMRLGIYLGIYEIVHGLRKFFLKDGDLPQLPPEFSNLGLMDPLDILAFYIIDEDFLHPLLLQATVFEYEVKLKAPGDHLDLGGRGVASRTEVEHGATA